MKVAEVQKIAQGRIWTAAQAKSRGLVDDFGGLDRALSVARQLAHLDKRAPVTVEGASESLLERLMLGRHADARAVAEAVEREQGRRAPLVRLLPRELRPFAASLSPMLSGEHVLAAMPYAVVIR
jgi:protease-4